MNIRLELSLGTLMDLTSLALFYVTLIFVYFDLLYYIRLYVHMWFDKLFFSRLKLHETCTLYDISFTPDFIFWWLWNWRMNETNLSREMEIARLDWCERTGVYNSVRNHNALIDQSVTYVTYNLEELINVPIFNLHIINTKFLCYDKEAFYLQSEINLPDNKTYCLVISRLAVTGMEVKPLLRSLYIDPSVKEFSPDQLIDYVKNCREIFNKRFFNVELRETLTLEDEHNPINESTS